MTEPDDPLASSTAPADPLPGGLHEWVSRVVEQLQVDPDVVDVDGLLYLAREVGHQVLRPAVPVTTFILGYALGSGRRDRARLEVLVGEVQALIREWDQDQGTPSSGA